MFSKRLEKKGTKKKEWWVQETGTYNQFIARCKGGVGDAHWGKYWICHSYDT